MGKRDSVNAWSCLLRAGRCLAMRRASVTRRRFQGWTEIIGFQEKMLCGCIVIGGALARCVWTCLHVHRCVLSGFCLFRQYNFAWKNHLFIKSNVKLFQLNCLSLSRNTHPTPKGKLYLTTCEFPKYFEVSGSS